MNIPLNIDWHQILLHLFNFAILAGGLYFLLYSPVRKFMEKRVSHFKELEDEANEKLSQANALEADYQKRISSMNADIMEMKAQAAKESEAASAEILKEARQQSEKILQAARASAEAEKERILNDAREEIAQIAVDATKKLLEEDPSKIYDDFLNATAKEQDGE